MNFQKLAISEDRLTKPVTDRSLPTHPKEIYGLLPYWYYRTRFYNYGSAKLDLPNGWARRRPEHTEQLWYKETKIKGISIYTHIFPVGMLLPYHELFLNAHPPLEVVGEKRAVDEPIGFHYL